MPLLSALYSIIITTTGLNRTFGVTPYIGLQLSRGVEGLIDFCIAIFIGAALFMHLENWSADRHPKLEYFDCVYFIITTMTTVGYGDISPSDNYSMAFTTCLMFYLILIIFPRVVIASNVLSKISMYNSGNACYEYQPVIVWQAEGEISINKLKRIAKELFSPHAPQLVTICLVGEDPPSRALTAYIHKPQRPAKILYIQGNLRHDAVANRAGLEYAKACILMHSEDCPESEIVEQDERICIMAMRCRQYTIDQCQQRGWATGPVELVLCLNKSYNAVYFESAFYGSVPAMYSNSTVALSVRELQMHCIAKGIVCPGFHPFIANIGSIRSNNKRSRQNFVAAAGESNWIKQYLSGADNECWMIELNPNLRDVPIPQISACLFHDTGCTLFRYQGIQGIYGLGKQGIMRVKVLATDWNTAEALCQEALARYTPETIQEHPVWDSDIDLPLHRTASQVELDFASITSLHHTTPLAAHVCESDLNYVYEEAGLGRSYGTLEEFSTRHFVQDPALRPLEEEEGLHFVQDILEEGLHLASKEEPDELESSQQQQPALIQPVASATLKSLKDHVVLVVQHIAHVLQFVVTLRSTDTLEEQQHDIVVVAGNACDVDARRLLCMFKRVYVVVIPNSDEGYLSAKTLRGLNIEHASHIVLTAYAGHTDHQTEVYDNHKMCLRGVIRSINPNCMCIMEVEDTSDARFFVGGSEKVNTWSNDPEMSHFTTVTNWSQRSDMINRASCSAAGSIVEEDAMLPLAISCLHKPSDLVLCEALLGGSPHNFSLVCVPVPSDFYEQTYEQLYVTMCKRSQQIPLALYRTCPTLLDEYIYTNPLPSTRLRKGDLVYCSQSHEFELHAYEEMPKHSAAPKVSTTATGPWGSMSPRSPKTSTTATGPCGSTSPRSRKTDSDTPIAHFENPISSKNPPPTCEGSDLHTLKGAEIENVTVEM